MNEILSRKDLHPRNAKVAAFLSELKALVDRHAVKIEKDDSHDGVTDYSLIVDDGREGIELSLTEVGQFLDQAR